MCCAWKDIRFFQFQEITAGSWKSVCSSTNLKTPHKKSAISQKFCVSPSFTPARHSLPRLASPPPFPFPHFLLQNSATAVSSLSQADGVRMKTGRRMKGEGWTGRQSWKIKAMKQNVLNCRPEEAARKWAWARDETSVYKLHELWNMFLKKEERKKILKKPTVTDSLLKFGS